MRTVLLLAVLLVSAACPHADTWGGDDAAAEIDSGVGDPALDTTEPEWPDDEPIPAAFDFPPFLNVLDPTTVIVSWRTATVTTGSVRFGRSPTYGQVATTPGPSNLHHVALVQLVPGAAYYYEVTVEPAGATRRGVFVVPGRSEFRFMHSGELHAPSQSGNVAKFAAPIRAFRPHVVIESGDMVDNGDDLHQWRTYFRTTAPWIGNVLLLPSQSNHVNGNGGNSLFQALFGIPNNERWYATRLGNVQVLNLDSTYTANADLPTTEVPWLRAQVQAAHDGHDDPTFVIASWHYPACSSQYRTRSAERSWVHEHFISTIRAAGGVDLVLAAHDRYYERSTITGGIVHVITAIGNVSPEIPGGNHEDCTAIKTSRTGQTTGLYTVKGSAMSARIVDQHGAEIDAFSIEK
ncbi:MAG: hypothetical protein H0T46_02890 [Deltaproteobacteria bacterium]|nr:hypothetical protein [Deltaproteobacteria bacterium]